MARAGIHMPSMAKWMFCCFLPCESRRLAMTPLHDAGVHSYATAARLKASQAASKKQERLSPRNSQPHVDNDCDKDSDCTKSKRFETLIESETWRGTAPKTRGEGAFSRTVLVRSSNRSLGEADEKRYVWKKFRSHSTAGMSAKEIREIAIENIKLVEKWQCPHTMIPVSTSPEVHHSRRFVWRWEKVYRDNGYILEEMTGDAASFVKDRPLGERGIELLRKCGPIFIDELLEALVCLRQHGYTHLDVKMDNVLYREGDPTKACPEFFLADFDLMTPVGNVPLTMTPPLKDLAETLSRLSLPVTTQDTPLTGAEDILALALAFRLFFDPDDEITDSEFGEFCSVAQEKLGCSAQDGDPPCEYSSPEFRFPKMGRWEDKGRRGV